ncbi:hypothetical protein CMEL01_03079 [Colletotrichum melonis]|uniref:Uncharacterized protein n=1 Tax=Colletotrichum melonis TaxID=1209925 RepID=A0AAI9UNU6_9PEZI|nr:hypothetical protein CMEL01_03079 [Colletotrichum melonis]
MRCHHTAESDAVSLGHLTASSPSLSPDLRPVPLPVEGEHDKTSDRKKSRRSWQESQTAKRKVIEIRRFTCLPTPVLPKRTSAVTLALGIDATFPALPFLHSGRDDSQPDWVKTTKNGGRTWDQNKALSETCHLLQPSSTDTSTSVYHSEFSIPPFALSSPTKPHQTQSQPARTTIIRAVIEFCLPRQVVNSTFQPAQAAGRKFGTQGTHTKLSRGPPVWLSSAWRTTPDHLHHLPVPAYHPTISEDSAESVPGSPV